MGKLECVLCAFVVKFGCSVVPCLVSVLKYVMGC